MNRLPLETTFNTRELGGIVTQTGNVTSYKQFLRSDDVANISEKDIQNLYDYGVRTVIDLRSAEEMNTTGHVLIEDERIDLHHLPLYMGNVTEIMEILESQKGATTFLQEYYLQILAEKNSLADVLRVILEAQEGGVLFHCKVGKDRTGVVAMILLGLADVAQVDIAANYEVTHNYIMQNPTVRAEAQQYPIDVFYSKAEYIQTAMDYITENYGSVKEYVRALGFTDEEIATLTARVVDEKVLAFA